MICGLHLVIINIWWKGKWNINLTLAMCCSLSVKSCLTHVSTAWKTFSSVEMLSWLLEISCSTCQEHTQAESEAINHHTFTRDGVCVRKREDGNTRRRWWTQSTSSAAMSAQRGKKNYKELNELTIFVAYAKTRFSGSVKKLTVQIICKTYECVHPQEVIVIINWQWEWVSWENQYHGQSSRERLYW